MGIKKWLARTNVLGRCRDAVSAVYACAPASRLVMVRLQCRPAGERIEVCALMVLIRRADSAGTGPRAISFGWRGWLGDAGGVVASTTEVARS